MMDFSLIPVGRGSFAMLNAALADGVELPLATEAGAGPDSFELLREQPELSELPQTGLPVSAHYGEHEFAHFSTEAQRRIDDVLRWPRSKVAMHLGITPTRLSQYLAAPDDRHHHITQRLCLMLNMRTANLPYAGGLLSTRAEIWKDFCDRVLTLGLTGERLQQFCGHTFAEMRTLIRDGEGPYNRAHSEFPSPRNGGEGGPWPGEGPLPPEIWDLLTTRFHMRLVPAPEPKRLREGDIPALYEKIKFYQKTYWGDMSDKELATYLGASSPADYSDVKRRALYNSQITRALAAVFGYEMGATHEALALWHRPLVFGQELAEALDHQKNELGLSDDEICRRVGVSDHHAHAKITRFLRGEVAKESVANAGTLDKRRLHFDVPRNRDVLLRFAGYLKIPLLVPTDLLEPLHREMQAWSEPLRPIFQPLPVHHHKSRGKSWAEEMPVVFSQVRQRRRQAWMSHRETMILAGMSSENLEEFEAAADSDQTSVPAGRKMGSLESLLDLFDIVIDPFARLQTLELAQAPGSDEFAAMVVERASLCPISTGRLGELCQDVLPARKFSLVDTRSVNGPTGRRLATLLKISWPGFLASPPPARVRLAHLHSVDAAEVATTSTESSVLAAPDEDTAMARMPLITSIDRAVERIKTECERRRWSVERLRREADISESHHHHIINRVLSRDDSYYTPEMMRMCRVLGFRFQGLALPGTVQNTPDEILEMFDARVRELELTSAEGKSLFGRSLASVRMEVLSAQTGYVPLPVTTARQINQVLHMRCMPQRAFTPVGNRAADLVSLGQIMAEQRDLAGYSKLTVQDITDVSETAQLQIESGQIPDDKALPRLERLVEFYGIMFDPFAALVPIYLVPLPTAAKLGELLRRAQAQTVISNKRLEALAGIPNAQSRANAFFGSVSPASERNVWVLNLAALLKIHLKTSVDDADSLGARVDQALGRIPMSDTDFCARYGVSREDLWAVRSGRMAEDEPSAIHIATLLEFDLPAFILDARLHAAITARMQVLGLKKTPLLESFGGHYNSFDIACDYLQRGPEDQREPSVTIRQLIYDVCDVLGITLVYRTTPPRFSRISGDGSVLALSSAEADTREQGGQDASPRRIARPARSPVQLTAQATAKAAAEFAAVAAQRQAALQAEERAATLAAARERQRQAALALAQRAAERIAQEQEAARLAQAAEDERRAAEEQHQAEAALRAEAELARFRAEDERRRNAEAQAAQAASQTRAELLASTQPIWVREGKGDEYHTEFRKILRERALLRFGVAVDAPEGTAPDVDRCRQVLQESPFHFSPMATYEIFARDVWRMLPLSDPKLLFLARELRVFTNEVVQQIMLSTHGDIATLCGETGRSEKELLPLFCESFADATGLAATVSRRRAAVKIYADAYVDTQITKGVWDAASVAERAGFSDTEAMQAFLARTGGEFRDHASIGEHWHLLFSFGDIESVALHLYQVRQRNLRAPSRDNPISSDLLVAQFMQHYQEWLRRVHGPGLDTETERRLLTGGQRLLPIHRDDLGLRRLLNDMVIRRPAKAKGKSPLSA